LDKKKNVKGYVFGDNNDNGKTKAFLKLLLKHQIKTYPINENVGNFQKGNAWYVPAEQAQYRMVSTFFEPVKTFYDSVFYDASACTVALAFDMPYQRYTSGKTLSTGNELTTNSLLPIRTTLPSASYAYLMEWNDYNAPKALYQLLKYKVFCKTSFKPFSADVNGQKKDFGYGTMMIPIADQNRTPEQLRIILQSVMNETNVAIHGVNTGFSLQGVDLGSRNFQTLELPKVAMLVGDGVSGYEAGEIWHLMDTRIGMPVTKVETNRFSRLTLEEYDVLILVSGNYGNLGENGIKKIKDWVKKGGTLITQRTATQWAIKNELAKANIKENKPTFPDKIAFADAREVRGARAIGGSIYLTDIDISHPLAFGYTRSQLPVYRNHTVFVEPSKKSSCQCGDLYRSSTSRWLYSCPRFGNLKRFCFFDGESTRSWSHDFDDR